MEERRRNDFFSVGKVTETQHAFVSGAWYMIFTCCSRSIARLSDLFVVVLSKLKFGSYQPLMGDMIFFHMVIISIRKKLG